MTPTLGRIVHYRLSDRDAEEINRRRKDFAAAEPGNSGFQGHVGNPVVGGQTFPAMVVRTGNFEGADNADICSLQVFLDGNDTLWAVSRAEGDRDGAWAWPPRS